MPKEYEIPEGKTIRKMNGGADLLKRLLLDLRKYSFSGFIKTILKAEEGPSVGYVIIKAGNPEISIHSYAQTKSTGKAALRRIWDDSAKESCNIEVHARIDVDELLDNLSDARIERVKKKADEAMPPLVDEKHILIEKLEVWRKAGYDVVMLEQALESEGDKARRVFEDYENATKKLEVLSGILDSMDTKGFEKEVAALKKKFNNPAKHVAIEAELQELQEKIENQKRIEELKTEEERREKEINERARAVFEMIVKHKVAEGKPLEDITESKVREEIESKAVTTKDITTNLISQYNFESFVVGPSNRFANAAAMAVAKTPHEAYNPLFITSGPGLGKTHLLNAIGNYVHERDPSVRILYASTEVFSNDFKEAVQNNSLPEFREKYRNLEMLLIDDVHFLSGKGDIQEELFHTFNALFNAGKQIAMTADRPPKDIPDVEDRLISRFESGLIADIQAPDFETRVAILKKRVQDVGGEIAPEVLTHIAHVVERNIRELGGALNRVIAFSSLMGQPASLELAKEVLKDIAPGKGDQRGKPSLDQIMRDMTPGRSYLIEEERAVNVFRILSKTIEGRGNGLVITRTNPKRIRERYGLRTERILWLTDRDSSAEETMPPMLERLIYTIEEFMRIGGKGAVMLDGIEYLVSNNSFEAVLRFLRRLIDHVSESQYVLLFSLSPKTMKEQEVRILEREMEVIQF